MKIPRDVLYHAKDINENHLYLCPKCAKTNFKKLNLKDTHIFSQEGDVVTIPYVCTRCKKEKRCFCFILNHKD